jgi:hypothetical protein
LCFVNCITLHNIIYSLISINYLSQRNNNKHNAQHFQNVPSAHIGFTIGASTPFFAQAMFGSSQPTILIQAIHFGSSRPFWVKPAVLCHSLLLHHPFWFKPTQPMLAQAPPRISVQVAKMAGEPIRCPTLLATLLGFRGALQSQQRNPIPNELRGP